MTEVLIQVLIIIEGNGNIIKEINERFGESRKNVQCYEVTLHTKE